MLQSDPPPKAVKVIMSNRIPLVGEELAAYEEEQERKRKEEALKATLVEEEESKSSFGAEVGAGDPVAIDTSIKQPSTNATSLQHGAFRDVLIDGFVPPPNCAGLMFPFYENLAEWDDFGEVINPDDYIIKDEHVDQGSMLMSFYWMLTYLGL